MGNKGPLQQLQTKVPISRRQSAAGNLPFAQVTAAIDNTLVLGALRQGQAKRKGAARAAPLGWRRKAMESFRWTLPPPRSRPRRRAPLVSPANGAAPPLGRVGRRQPSGRSRWTTVPSAVAPLWLQKTRLRLCPRGPCPNHTGRRHAHPQQHPILSVTQTIAVIILNTHSTPILMPMAQLTVPAAQRLG